VIEQLTARSGTDLKMAKLLASAAICKNGGVTIYPELDPFLVSFDEGEKIGNDWDQLLDVLDFLDIPDIDGVHVRQFVCKMGKSSRNKRKKLEKYQLIYSDIGPLMSTGTPLSQDEAKREAMAISIYERYSIQEEERPVIKTMAYSDKYKKILDEICVDKRKLDGMNKEEEEAIIRIKGEALIEKDDPGAFVIPIRLEGKINLNALIDTGSDINVIPCRIYKELGREEVQNV
ncbi:reverse transcriptase domain-containing protein, partial [Tanacetum coccineum]